MAIGTGTDVAIEASDLTLVSGDLHAAADAIRLSRATLGTIKQNLAWAFGYNLAALPLAALGLLNPVIAGAAMTCSSVSVVANALRLRRSRPLAPARSTSRPPADPTPPAAGDGGSKGDGRVEGPKSAQPNGAAASASVPDRLGAEVRFAHGAPPTRARAPNVGTHEAGART